MYFAILKCKGNEEKEMQNTKLFLMHNICYVSLLKTAQ